MGRLFLCNVPRVAVLDLNGTPHPVDGSTRGVATLFKADCGGQNRFDRLGRIPPIEEIPRRFPQTRQGVVLGPGADISARVRFIGTYAMPKPSSPICG